MIRTVPGDELERVNSLNVLSVPQFYIGQCEVSTSTKTWQNQHSCLPVGDQNLQTEIIVYLKRSQLNKQFDSLCIDFLTLSDLLTSTRQTS